MSNHDFRDWTPQEPPADFAERAVVAMLAAGAVQAAPEPAAKNVLPLRRSWGLIGLAAIFMGASAWGMLGTRQAPVVEAPSMSEDVAEAVAAPPPVLADHGARWRRAETPASEPVSSAQAVRPAPKTASTALSPTHPPGQPPCHCETDLAICTCVE
jgi:hypothetical protein